MKNYINSNKEVLKKYKIKDIFKENWDDFVDEHNWSVISRRQN